MAHCPFIPWLAAYHDGELDAVRRADVERHLSFCGVCPPELARLRELSAWFAADARPALLPIARLRLHRGVEAAMEKGLLRTAWALSGVAAAVLLAGSLWMTRGTETPRPASPPPWVEVAAASDAADTARATPAAEWYLADASPRGDDQP